MVAMLTLVASAQPTTMQFNDDERNQTITVTAVGEDIVRVDVVPDDWNGKRLPSLVIDKVPKFDVKVNDWEDISVMRTGGGMKVVLDRNTGSVSVSCV